MSALRFAKLAPEHIDSILEIEAISNPAPWTRESFQHELTNPNSRFYVGLLNGKLIGYGAIWLVVDEAHIITLSVDPDMRRHGYGRQLVEVLLDEARESGMTCATLEVRAGNAAAISLYESFGFQTAAKRRGYYPNNKEDALVMWLYSLSA